MNEYHTTVLLHEAVDGLQVKKDHKYIDATLGGGGHSFEIVKRGGIVLGIDQDEDALEHVKQEVRSEQQLGEHSLEVGNKELRNLTIVYGNFAHLLTLARNNGFEKVSGVLFDIGISGHHIDEAERGFSLLRNGPLDMRMDKNLQVTAKDLVNGLTRHELIELFTKYGEEPFAKKIADAISKAREEKAIETTGELASIIARAYPRKSEKIHPATKVFQALRVAVNDELHSLEDALPQALEVLDSKGRIAVISFHSLEDRIIKQTFLEFQEKGWGKVITDKPIEPSWEEQERNRRSRSAKLRVFEKA